MDRAPLCLLVVAGLALMPAAAFAGHGRVGLWTVTSTIHMSDAPQIPPEALAMMKARHMPIPNSGEPMTTQMCMTQEQVNADKPPAMSNREESCDSKVLNQTPALMEAQITCHGHMEGVGHVKVSWRGTDHYEGDYNFKGTMEGRPREITTHYTGDFVKADCGAVKPFVPPKPMQ